MRDPKIYTHPDDFEPERHLRNGALMAEDLGRFTFGFGRRVCPGKAFAEDSLWVVVAQVLAVFDISSPEVNLQARFTSGMFS